nr:WAP four-disulfide core domain protein 5-like isoform X1 [Anolis sagrei ordinatus]
MTPWGQWLLVGLFMLGEGRQASEYGEERKGKAGFCVASPNGLYSPPCKVSCEGDTECPGEEKCCQYACNYQCVPPCREKSGHCPPPLTKKLNSPAMCGTLCTEDKGCPGKEKCCETSCGRVCMAPLEEKPGKCPRRQRVKKSPEEPCFDTCLQDQQCPGETKCCFTGCAMNCANAQQDVSTQTDLQ